MSWEQAPLTAASSKGNFLLPTVCWLWLQFPWGSLAGRQGHPKSWTDLPEGLDKMMGEDPRPEVHIASLYGGGEPGLPVSLLQKPSPLGHVGRNLPESPDTHG